MFLDLDNVYVRQEIELFAARHAGRMEGARKALIDAAHMARDDPRPLAVVLDIDEVLLSNVYDAVWTSPQGVAWYAADYFADAWGHSWPRGETPFGPALPGALQLLEAARAHNIAVFYVTGRSEDIRPLTVANFESQGIGAPEDFPALKDSRSLALCMRPHNDTRSTQAFKQDCRAAISRTHRIVLNLGDQASDLGEFGDVQLLLPHCLYFTL
jgi:predicted secreted acid phosphatase